MNTSNLIKLSSHQAYLRYSEINALNTSHRINWIKDCENNDTFSEGGENQWTEEELAALKKRGNYTVTMDMTRKAISGIVGMFTANKPDLRAVCSTEGYESAAKIRTMQLKQTFKDSDGLLRLREILTNAYRSNIAYAFVSPFKNRVTFRMLTYKQVMVEQSSTDPLFRDAEFIVITKWTEVEKVKAMFGVESINTTYPTDVNGTEFHMTNPNMRLYNGINRYMQLFEIYKKIPVRQEDGSIVTRISREILIGYQYLYKDILPPSITEYPIIPVYSSLSSNPLKHSEMHFMKEGQRFINKMYNITIMNAQATGSPKVFVRTTDIPNEDIETFSNNYAIPGSINELNPGAEAPVLVQAQPINNAFFTLYQDATQYLFRIYSSLGLDGNATDSSANNNAAGLYEKREAVMDSLKTMSGIYESFLKQLGKCILQAWSAYVNKDEVVKTCNANRVLKQVEEDISVGLDVKNKESIAKWTQEMKKNNFQDAEIEQLLFDAKERSEFIDAIFDNITGIDDLEYGVTIVQDSYSPSYQASKFNIAMQLAGNGVIDSETLLKLSPLDDKEAILRRLSVTKQLQSQNKELQEMVQKLQQELESKDQQVTDAVNQISNIKHETDLYKVGVDARYKSKENTKTERVSSMLKGKELDFAIRDLLLTLKENKDQVKNLSYEEIRNAIQIG